MKSFHTSIFVLLLIVPAFSQVTTVSEVEKYLMCTCGCTMPLYTCECQKSEEMRANIQQMIKNGQTREQIIEAYVAKYGEKILSAPTREGFNLLAWVMPFLAVIVVGSILMTAVKRWSRNSASVQGASTPPLEKKYQERLEEELAKLEEGESR